MKQVCVAEFDVAINHEDVFMKPENVENGRKEWFYHKGRSIGLITILGEKVKKKVSFTQIIGNEVMETKIFRKYWLPGE